MKIITFEPKQSVLFSKDTTYGYILNAFKGFLDSLLINIEKKMVTVFHFKIADSVYYYKCKSSLIL